LYTALIVPHDLRAVTATVYFPSVESTCKPTNSMTLDVYFIYQIHKLIKSTGADT